MESLYENKPLLYSVMASTSAIVALASGMLPDLAAQFEIVELETEVRDDEIKSLVICYYLKLHMN